MLALSTRWEGMKRDDLPQKQLPSLKAVQEHVGTEWCRLAPSTYWNDPFWLLKLFFILSLYYYSHHRKYLMSTCKVSRFTRAAELTSVRYLQMDPTEINMAALHSSHILAVIHQRDEHHYRQKNQNELSSESQRWQIILDVFIISPDQGYNEDELTNRTKSKVLPWLTCFCARYGDPFSPTANECSSRWHSFCAHPPLKNCLFHKTPNQWVAVTHYISTPQSFQAALQSQHVPRLRVLLHHRGNSLY